MHFLQKLLSIFKKTTEIIFLIFNFLSAQKFPFCFLWSSNIFLKGESLKIEKNYFLSHEHEEVGYTSAPAFPFVFPFVFSLAIWFL